MSTVQRFQDLKAWQLPRELNRRAYDAPSGGHFARDFALRDQIRRASMSVSSNVAEGFERRSPRDFARFRTIANASAAEVLSQMYLALDVDCVTQADFDRLAALLDETSPTIGGLLRDLRTTSTASVREDGLPYPELGPQNSECLGP